MDLSNLNIKHAVKNRLLLEFTDISSRKVMKVEPYYYGVTRDGMLGLQAFQISAGKESEEVWKLFDFDKVKDVKVLSEQFDPTVRQEHQEHSKAMKIIYFKI